MAGKKINYVGVNLDDDDYDLLSNLCGRLNEPMSQVIRDSLHFLDKALKEKEKK